MMNIMTRIEVETVKQKRIIYENENITGGIDMQNAEFRTPEDMTADSRYAVRQHGGISFYLTDTRLIRETIYHIDDSEYTVRSEFNRKADQDMNALIKRLVEAEAADCYKKVS